MARWEPDAAGRLREAALELYVERGFEQTTVAEIAQRAGVTARTFFRHFTDKREVLFAKSSDLLDALVRALAGAPPGATPMQAVAVALDAAAVILGQRHAFSRRRQSVIDAHAELRERELIKMATLSAALAGGLRERGVPDPEAALAAEAGVVVLRVAFERWVALPEPTDLTRSMRETLIRLTAVTADAPWTRNPPAFAGTAIAPGDPRSRLRSAGPPASPPARRRTTSAGSAPRPGDAAAPA